MAKKLIKQESFVTQSQWAEGMEMIKDFFGKVMSEIQGVKTEIIVIKEDITEIKTDIVEMKIDITEMKTDIVEMKINIETNTQAINLVSKQQQETQNLEFDIYDHGERIKKLEKAKS